MATLFDANVKDLVEIRQALMKIRYFLNDVDLRLAAAEVALGLIDQGKSVEIEGPAGGEFLEVVEGGQLGTESQTAALPYRLKKINTEDFITIYTEDEKTLVEEGGRSINDSGNAVGQSAVEYFTQVINPVRRKAL